MTESRSVNYPESAFQPYNTMIRHMRYLLYAFVLIVITACSPDSAEEQSTLAHLYDYRWSLPADPDRAISTTEVSAVLHQYDVIFFGELHNHPGIHLAQMELFSRLYQANSNISLSMEQFERDTQPLLDQYMAREIGEEYLIEQARAWDHYRSSYRPLVEFARNRQIPVIASNAPKQMVVCVGRLGLDVLDKYPPQQRQYVAQEINVSEGAYWQKFKDFMNADSAHQAPSDSDSQAIMQTMTRRSFAAQALRDDTMAESIARHLKNNPERQVVHLNGNFHSSEFLGTVERLRQRMPALKIAVIHALHEQEVITLDPARPSGNILLTVRSIPEMFVNDQHEREWLNKTMRKRMEKRKNCPE